MKIAFATADGLHVDAHFGSAPMLALYDVTPTGFTFLENLIFEKHLQQDGNEDKVDAKLSILQNCTLIYVAAIGPAAAARLIGRQVMPIKASPDENSIQALLAKLVDMLNGNPPPWLRKALKQPATAQ